MCTFLSDEKYQEALIADLQRDNTRLQGNLSARVAEVTELGMAVGVAITALDKMVIHPDDPVGMMQQVVVEMDRLRVEIFRLENYADQLAKGLPEGMLPADVRNIKEANVRLQVEDARLNGIVDEQEEEIRRLNYNVTELRKTIQLLRAQNKAHVCDVANSQYERDKWWSKWDCARLKVMRLENVNRNLVEEITQLRKLPQPPTRVGRVIDEQEAEIAELKAALSADSKVRQKLTEAIEEVLPKMERWPRTTRVEVVHKLKNVIRQYGTE